MAQRATYRAAVYVIPMCSTQILLAQRYNTGFGDGFYSFIAGHVEAGESVTDTAVREAREETGILIERDDLHFVHVMHRRSEDDLVYYDFFFTVDRWQGTPTICEPHRCSDLRWAEFNRLPENTLPYIQRIVQAVFIKGEHFDELGWR